jgi:hypothetical protein
MNRFADKIALVTGGGSGIGRATAVTYVCGWCSRFRNFATQALYSLRFTFQLMLTSKLLINIRNLNHGENCSFS